MAYEVTTWKHRNCDIAVRVDTLTNRETYSREINEKYGEGGDLNANYKQVEAVAIIASTLAAHGLRYGSHWVFKTVSGDNILLDFCDKRTRAEAEDILLKHHIVIS